MGGFNDIPNKINKSKGILNAGEGKYESAAEVDGTQAYYKYQGIGRTRAKAPDPPPATDDIVLSVGDYFNVFFGYSSVDTLLGEINPRNLLGTPLTRIQYNNSTAPLRSEIMTEGDVQIDGRDSLTYMVDDLPHEYVIGWSLNKYIHDSYEADPDHQAWADLLAYIMSKNGQDVVIKFLT